MRRKCGNPLELVLPFDFWEEEKKREKEEIQALPYFSRPKNDQERLFNLQKDFYTGDESALNKIFVLLLKIAPRLINKEMHQSFGRQFPQDDIDAMATDAVILFVNQIKSNRLMIQKSFLAYLRLQVLKAMNKQTTAEKFEKFCVKKHINLFELYEDEKQAVKTMFEKELNNDGDRLEEPHRGVEERKISLWEAAGASGVFQERMQGCGSQADGRGLLHRGVRAGEPDCPGDLTGETQAAQDERKLGIGEKETFNMANKIIAWSRGTKKPPLIFSTALTACKFLGLHPSSPKFREAIEKGVPILKNGYEWFIDQLYEGGDK